MQVLVQFVPEYFMGLSRLCTRLLGADDRMQGQFGVHIFMDCCLPIAVPPALQIGRHATVPFYSIMVVVDLFNLLLSLLFLGVITRLPVFPVVIVGIRTVPQPP